MHGDWPVSWAAKCKHKGRARGLFFYGDGSALYLLSGDGYRSLYMELNCVEPYKNTGKQGKWWKLNKT